jgi:hypothetical protein
MTGTTDALEHVLRLVAEGRLTAKEAEPILAALDATPAAQGADTGPEPAGPPRFARIQVTESGRPIVNMRIPLAFGIQALAAVPGLSSDHATTLRAAVDAGLRGPILDVTDEHGDGTRIVIE